MIKIAREQANPLWLRVYGKKNLGDTNCVVLSFNRIMYSSICTFNSDNVK